MEDIFKFLDSLTDMPFIVVLIFVLLIIKLLLIIAIFTIAGNTTALKNEIKELKKEQKETMQRQEMLLAEIAGYKTNNYNNTEQVPIPKNINGK